MSSEFVAWSIWTSVMIYSIGLLYFLSFGIEPHHLWKNRINSQCDEQNLDLRSLISPITNVEEYSWVTRLRCDLKNLGLPRKSGFSLRYWSVNYNLNTIVSRKTNPQISQWKLRSVFPCHSWPCRWTDRHPSLALASADLNIIIRCKSWWVGLRTLISRA